MTYIVELDPQAEAWISKEAQRLHLSPTEMVRRVVQERAASEPSSEGRWERAKALMAKWQVEDRTPVIPAPIMREGETPTQALFRQWEEEDANLTEEEQEDERSFWEDYQKSIDAERTRCGMRTIFECQE